jgi:hypothetical protein
LWRDRGGALIEVCSRANLEAAAAVFILDEVTQRINTSAEK